MLCLKCSQPSEEGAACRSCGADSALPTFQQGALSSPTPRAPIRSQPSPGPDGPQQKFYKPAATMRVPRGETPPMRMSPLRVSPLLAGTSGCYGARNPAKGKRGAQRPQLNDPSEC